MSELSSVLQPLRAKFIATIPQRIVDLEVLATRLTGDSTDLQALNEIGQVAHRISGVAETLGFTQLGRLAAQIDRQMIAVRNQEEAPLWAWARTEPVVEALMDELEAQLED